MMNHLYSSGKHLSGKLMPMTTSGLQTVANCRHDITRGTTGGILPSLSETACFPGYAKSEVRICGSQQT